MLLTQPAFAHLKIDYTTWAEHLVSSYALMHGEDSAQHALAKQILRKVRVFNRDIHNSEDYRCVAERLAERAKEAYDVLESIAKL